MSLKTKSLTGGFKVKAESDVGSFSAYGNTFGNVDLAGDKTMKGAFTKCISSWNAMAKQPRLLGQHGHKQNPIGIITSMKEDETGLLFEGKFCLDTQAGKEAYALVKMGAMDSFSIGYAVLQEKMVGGVNELHELDVKEISLVTFACNENSLIQSVKSALESGEAPTSRMIQKALQEAGLSKRQSEAAINAITVTGEAEQKAKTAMELFKTKAAEFVVKVDESKMEVKGEMSMRDYTDMICRAVKAKVETDDNWCYTVDIYMDYVIVCVYEEKDEEYREYYVKVPYSVNDDKDVLVGTPVEVKRITKWLTDAEIAAYEAAKKEGAKSDDGEEDVDLPGTKSEDEPEPKDPEEALVDELKSVDFTTWLK